MSAVVPHAEADWAGQSNGLSSRRLFRLYVGMVAGFLLPTIVVFLLPIVFYQQPMRNRIGELVFDLTEADILRAIACVVLAMFVWWLMAWVAKRGACQIFCVPEVMR